MAAKYAVKITRSSLTPHLYFTNGLSYTDITIPQLLKPVLKKIIKKTGHQVQRFFKMNHGQKAQKYKVSYEVTVTNNSAKEKKLFVIIPVPQSSQNQKIEGTMLYEPAKIIVQKEKLYGNSYALWETNLKTGETQKYTENFIIEVKPHAIHHNKNGDLFTLSDYKKTEKNLQPEIIKFLQPNHFVNGNDEKIQKMAAEVKKSIPSENVMKLAQKINRFVINYLEYKNPIPGLYTYKQALEQKTVDCGGFATLFISLCNALGIPARVVCGFYAGYQKNTMHAWAECILPDGTWIPVDPSVEQLFQNGKTNKLGRFGYYGSDQIIFSVGCDMKIPLLPSMINAEKHDLKIDILQNPVIYPEDPEIKVDMQVLTSQPLKFS